MTKGEMVDALANRMHTTKGRAADIIDAMFSADNGVISVALQAGEKVQITGFGAFEVRDRKARMGRNPATGATIHIPAQRAPAFRAGKALKDATNH
jgi:DNA-binding protein HU-beta